MTLSTRTWLLIVGVLIGIGAGAVALTRHQFAPAPAPAANAAPLPVRAAAATTPSVSAASPAASSDVPPWARLPDLPAPGAAAAPGPEQQRAMMAALKSRTEQQAQATRALLAELDRREAAHQIPPGMDAKALRNNLLVSQKLQQLSLQIQSLATQPDGPQRTAAFHDKLAELQTLQRQVRLDVMVPSQAAATGTP